MEIAPDLSPAMLSELLPEREIRSYPALLSTEADAQSWARQGAPTGALVVADYQASPRGRAGFEWVVTPGRTLAFSLVVRPTMKAEREGWLYTAATSGVADIVGEDVAIEWPDALFVDERVAARVGVHAELGSNVVLWAVVNVLIPDAEPPRGPLLARIVSAIEARMEAPTDEVLRDYLPRLRTIGRGVRARMIPLGPGGPQVTGKAVGSLMDGALLLETPKGNRVAIRPQNLGILDDWTGDDQDSEPASAF
ncbi:MAG: biotin--[acetyl-CoA-carboxylase] ligase [Actinomycetota bacterium]